MAVWLAYFNGHYAPENAPKAFIFAAPEPIVSIADELTPLCPAGLPNLSHLATPVKLFDTPTGAFADAAFDGFPVNVKGYGHGNSFPVSADNAGVPVWLIFRPLGVPGHESRFHSALIGAADAAAAVVAAKALAGTQYPTAFEGYRVVQIGVTSASGFKNTLIEGDALEFYGLTRGGDAPARRVPNAHLLGVAAGTMAYALQPTGGRKGVTRDTTVGAYAGVQNPARFANVIMFGASIEEYSFGNATQGSAPLKQHVADLAAKLGMNVVGRGVASEAFAQHLVTAVAVKAEFAASQGKNLYVVHVGGNNVTSRRPYSGDATADSYFATNLRAVYDLLAAGGDQVVFCNLSKRDYVAAPAQAALPTADTNGSLPYNTACYHPFIKSVMPQWWDYRADKPLLDFYSFVERHESRFFVAADGIHPHVGTYAAVVGFYLSRLHAFANGLDNVKGQRSGRAFVFVPRSAAYPIYTSNLNYLRFDGQAQPQQGKGLIAGAWDLQGNYDPFIEFATDGWRGQNTGGGSGASGHARIADTRLQLGDAVLLDAAFSDSTATTPAMFFANLIPGETGRVTMVGSRALSDAVRNCTWTMNGSDAKVHNAAANAASNTQFWDFTVPASGTLTLQGSVGASNTGYCGAVMIEFN